VGRTVEAGEDKENRKVLLGSAPVLREADRAFMDTLQFIARTSRLDGVLSEECLVHCNL
jgi:hypothetical protein